MAEGTALRHWLLLPIKVLRLDIHRVVQHIIARRVIRCAIINLASKRSRGSDMVLSHRPVAQSNVRSVTLLAVLRTIIGCKITRRNTLTVQSEFQ